MKKIICLILALIICISLCGCTEKETDTDINSTTDSAQNADTESGTAEEDTTEAEKATDEFISAVCGKWEKYSGVYYEITYLELREDGVCLIDGEEYTWDATFKEKYWLDEPKEFVNIYKDGEIVYDVQLEEHIDGSPALRFGEASDVASPAAVFLKAEEQ